MQRKPAIRARAFLFLAVLHWSMLFVFSQYTQAYQTSVHHLGNIWLYCTFFAAVEIFFRQHLFWSQKVLFYSSNSYCIWPAYISGLTLQPNQLLLCRLQDMKFVCDLISHSLSSIWTADKISGTIAFYLIVGSILYSKNMRIELNGRWTIAQDLTIFQSPPADIPAMTTVWRIKGVIIRTVLCCVLYYIYRLTVT